MISSRLGSLVSRCCDIFFRYICHLESIVRSKVNVLRLSLHFNNHTKYTNIYIADGSEKDTSDMRYSEKVILEVLVINLIYIKKI